MKILHLIDPASPAGGPCTLRLVAEAMSRVDRASHEALVFGAAEHVVLARRCGVPARLRVGCTLIRPGFGPRALREALRAIESESRPYDLLHAWTPGCASAAVAIGRRPLTGTILGLGLGLGTGNGSRLRPAVDPGVIALEDRPELRAGWGADETAFVVGLLGEPPDRLDAESALAAVGRVAMTGRDIKLVLHRDAARHSTLRRWLGKLGLADALILDDRVAEPWVVVSGLDAALLATRPRPRPRDERRGAIGRLAGRVTDAIGLSGSLAAAAGDGPLPMTLPLLWAMAAGLPVIAEDCEVWGEVIDDGHSGLLFEQGGFNTVALHILNLFEDAHLARRLGAAARALIEKRFDPETFAERLGDAYGALVSGATDREAPAPRRDRGSPERRPEVTCR